MPENGQVIDETPSARLREKGGVSPRSMVNGEGRQRLQGLSSLGWLMESLCSFAGGDIHKDGASTP